jgi:hypothetical protein
VELVAIVTDFGRLSKRPMRFAKILSRGQIDRLAAHKQLVNLNSGTGEEFMIDRCGRPILIAARHVIGTLAIPVNCRTCFRTNCASFRRLGRLCLFTACLSAILVATQASATMFRFHAQIASVFETDGGAGLPFSVATDEKITATYSFDSTTGGPHFPQISSLSFNIAGLVVVAPTYTIGVHDEDIPNAAPISGSIADPLNTPIVDQAPGSSDNIFLTCNIPQHSFCAIIPEFTQLRVRPLIGFSTDADVLSSGNLVADKDLWNAFSFREMSLVFHDLESGGNTYIGAYIGAVQEIPEPRAAFVALIGASIWAGTFARSLVGQSNRR